jgi:cytochrome b561
MSGEQPTLRGDQSVDFHSPEPDLHRQLRTTAASSTSTLMLRAGLPALVHDHENCCPEFSHPSRCLSRDRETDKIGDGTFFYEEYLVVAPPLDVGQLELCSGRVCEEAMSTISADTMNEASVDARRRDFTSLKRYTPIAQVLHWLTALLMFAVIPLGWHMTMLARNDPHRESWYTVHKSIGLAILALAILRLGWRRCYPPPPLPGTMASVERFVATLSHWLLYAVLLFMPVSGYLFSAAGNHPVTWFGLFTVPVIVPINPALSSVGRSFHLAGQWATYGLIMLHVLGTAWHVVIRRDGVLERILPTQDRVDSN